MEIRESNGLAKGGGWTGPCRQVLESEVTCPNKQFFSSASTKLGKKRIKR